MLAEWAGVDRRYRRRSEFSGKAVTGFNPVTAFLLLSVSSPTSAWSENIGEDDSPSLKGLPSDSPKLIFRRTSERAEGRDTLCRYYLAERTKLLTNHGRLKPDFLMDLPHRAGVRGVRCERKCWLNPLGKGVSLAGQLQAAKRPAAAFCPPWQGGLQGVWYKPRKTPCRKSAAKLLKASIPLEMRNSRQGPLGPCVGCARWRTYPGCRCHPSVGGDFLTRLQGEADQE